MDKKIIAFLSSTRLMAVLFITFAIALAAGTFIEDRYNTITARILIYNTTWFELIMALFLFNFVGNIKRYRLYKKEKWATLLLHLSFVLILIGSFITRYISFEGMMPIREGETADAIYSDQTYLTVMTDGDYQGEMRRRTFEQAKLFSPATNNDFIIKKEFNDIPFEIEYKDFIMGAQEAIAEDPNGIYFLKLVESGDGERHEHYLKEGEVVNIHNVLYALNSPTEGAINITVEGDQYFIESPFEGNYMVMATQAKGMVTPNEKQAFNLRSLYTMAGTSFVVPEVATKGKITYVSNNDFKDKATTDALIVTVKSQGQEKEVILKGKAGRMGEPQSFKLGDLEFTMMYGSKVYTTPFKITLNDFIAEKYPGTEKRYSSFESQVTVVDGKESFDARIYMNNILDYQGYRFFQAQFDPDEKGTILSVNHDFYGTWVTYIGYFLLYIGMLAILLDKNTRFDDLRKKLNKVREKKATLMTILVLLFSTTLFAQHGSHSAPQSLKPAVVDSLIQANAVSKEHAAKFGQLVIQDFGGRMKPVNTFSSELLRKVYQSESYHGLNPDQVLLSITQFTVAQQMQGAPNFWYFAPFIQLQRGNSELRKALDLPTDAKYASFVDFFDANGNYKLAKQVEDANKDAIKNKFQTDYLDIDGKINLLGNALSGRILTIFPIPGHDNDKWISPLELNESGMTGMDSTFTKSILSRMYIPALFQAQENGDYTKADEYLGHLKTFQQSYGKKVIPSEKRIEYEILYNQYDIFKTLYKYYMLVAIFTFIFIISSILKRAKWSDRLIKIGSWLTVVLFGIHTLGLAVRWYISGHAPWSDAYESVIYVAWATTLFGLYFGRKSELTIASTAFVAGMVLWAAHLNYMDPAIGNLQPVLNSYWLIIHVAVIVASYGPFTLGMILGVVTLLLMIMTTSKNKKKMELNIKELTYINEMALTVGLVLLTIGNFLGGQWANESWGRYWGWDPKETWALISIMIYAFVIHARLVPAMRGTWIYNVFSILAYYSIMMTYFGVNFYLSGLHSYASGDKVITPTIIWWSIAFVSVLSIASYIQYKRHLKKPSAKSVK